MDKEVTAKNAIESKILTIRNQQVMIDRDLAELYGVETRRLNEQVKRNSERFPKEFCFQLTESEYENLMSQIATSSFNITSQNAKSTWAEQENFLTPLQSKALLCFQLS